MKIENLTPKDQNVKSHIKFNQLLKFGYLNEGLKMID